MSEMTTAEMVEMLRTRVCGREVGDAIAARLSALDKVAKAAANVAWAHCNDKNHLGISVSCVQIALKEAGYGE